ncbi:NmrA family transcriptional regulator [Burkholderia seminalis]|uniref:NmrA family transcriptional regulator n=1 Tax=Burkholderia seminalis TaxID=488731 RepID=UPI0008416C6A|nr:NmrA family transcriptional regulator [Burkholderia seminalis]AOJ26823.1 NmrA family transcriptional regulator [Burkholderia seminalis]MCA8043768.1 NmrA family transcriptional regulator [Burkholderia seminalis]
MSALPILVVGGSGKTGARVDARLRARGIATRPVSRTSAVRFDWTAPATWPAALEGVSAAYVTYQPDLSVEGAVEAIAAFARLARERGVARVVLLSGRGEPGAQATEAALQASGIGWGVARASWFNQNFSEGYLLDGVLAGEVALPAGAVREPFVDADDIADVVVAALTDVRFADRVIEVTGPRALTFAEAVGEIARAAGRPVTYREISHGAFVAELHEVGVPEPVVALLDDLFRVVLDGRNSAVAHGIEETLGRPARDFADYARATAATGVWSA